MDKYYISRDILKNIELKAVTNTKGLAQACWNLLQEGLFYKDAEKTLSALLEDKSQADSLILGYALLEKSRADKFIKKFKLPEQESYSKSKAITKLHLNLKKDLKQAESQIKKKMILH